MSMTDAEFSAWLASKAARPVLLVEVVASVGGVETTRYLSDRGYVTAATDTPANTHYEPRISGGCTITQSLSLDGQASVAWGDIELTNADGGLDDWLDDVWANRALSMYCGDATWPRADFRRIFSGTVEDIDSSRREALNLKLRDKMQRLNAPLTETQIGGTGPNKDAPVPLTFGECHNVAPVLVDAATLQYRIHDGAAEEIIEVRDSGVPVTVTKSLAGGTFTLSAAPIGQITASVQGDDAGGTYRSTIATLIERIVTGYGTSTGRLSAGDIDSANFAAFDAAHLDPVGLWAPDRLNVIEACRMLAASVGAQMAFSAEGKLQLHQIAIPASGTAIDHADMTEGSLEIAARPAVRAAVKLGYCRNWAPQNVESGIPAEHRAMFESEWLTVTSADAAVASAYKTFAEPALEETLLLVESNAQAESDRRLALWKVQRHVYRCECGPKHMLLALGAGATLTAPRFGLDAGKTGQIVGLRRDWLARRVVVEVLA